MDNPTNEHENQHDLNGDEQSNLDENASSFSHKENDQSSNRFPIVGIGASAGGLEALQELFRNMPDDTGMAFVIITHQHPGHESLLPEILSRETTMDVIKIVEGVHVLPNRIYTLGAAAIITIRDDILHLEAIQSVSVRNMPIDIFFRSLADDVHERAICIVLSGTGSDGTIGMKEVKAHGGMALSQELPSAKYSGMPSSAKDTGLVDFVASPANMPKLMINYIWGPYLQASVASEENDHFQQVDIDAILRFLRSRLGHDFSLYKPSTIKRRIQRRISVHGLTDAREYLEYLHQNRPEIHLLFSELLISVTSFFRDSEAFAMLKEAYLPQLIKSRPDNHEFRVWVAGCATGEEAYSIAILLDELRQELRKPFDIRIFGTDLDDQAIQRARHAVYPASILVDVSKERLEHYFVPDGDDAFAIRKEIRDMLVFAPQNLLSDPPFMKLDLLVCRNVLIYLQSNLQRLLLPTFHYSISPDGLLFLGASESVGVHTELFDMLDTRWKIYRRRNVPTELPQLPNKPEKIEPAQHEKMAEPVPRQPHTNKLVERMLLDRFAPVSIVIDRQGTIMYIHGRTGSYLEPEQQQPRNNILEMAREGLRLPLSLAIHQVQEKNEDIVRQNVRVKTNGGYSLVNFNVSNISSPEALRGLLLITIAPELVTQPVVVEAFPVVPNEKAPGERIEELEHELVYVKETNQTMVEELQSTNEELQSANEELQSTNEELQSSKEEMESLNEELTTVNNELNSKMEALSQARDDMQNLLNSTDLAVIFLDERLRVKRFTAKARTLVNLRDSDIGRPISDLTAQLQDDNLQDECTEVLDTLMRKEKEVTTRNGGWQLMRILPYRTSENVIGGVVVTFVEITRMKEALIRSVAAEEHMANLLNHIPIGIRITDLIGRTLQSNCQANEIWAGNVPVSDISKEHNEFRYFWPATGNIARSDDLPIGKALKSRAPVYGTELNIQRLDGSIGTVIASAAPLLDKKGDMIGAVGIEQDVTVFKQTEKTLLEQVTKLKFVTDAARFGMFGCDLQTDTTIWENPLIYEILGIVKGDSPVNLEQFARLAMEPDELNRFLKDIEACRQGEKVLEGRYYIRRLDGQQRRLIEFFAMVEYSEQKKPVRLIGVVKDITGETHNSPSLAP